MFGKPHRLWHSLVLVGSSVALLCAQTATGPAIDTSLFGDNTGPAIDEWPDTGDGAWMEVEEPPAPPQATAPTPVPTIPGINTKSTPNSPATPRSSESNKPQADDPATAKTPKRSLLPWKRRNQERTARDAAEREKNGPRLSEVKTRTSSNGEVGAADTGLLPSELHRWRRDPRGAMKEARRERKLLLLWMTDSKRVEAGTQLAIELFRHTHFLRMARDYMVLTRVDYGEREIREHSYAKMLKKELNAVGFPIMMLFTPEGEEVWRHVGYRPGRFSSILGDLKIQAQNFALKEKYRYEKLEEKGYRFWTNYKNKPMFARAVELSREEKMVTLLDEAGKRTRYPVLKLSTKDRAFLSEQFPKP